MSSRVSSQPPRNTDGSEPDKERRDSRAGRSVNKYRWLTRLDCLGHTLRLTWLPGFWHLCDAYDLALGTPDTPENFPRRWGGGMTAYTTWAGAGDGEPEQAVNLSPRAEQVRILPRPSILEGSQAAPGSPSALEPASTGEDVGEGNEPEPGIACAARLVRVQPDYEARP